MRLHPAFPAPAQIEWDAVVQSVGASTYDAAWLYSHRHGAPDDDYVEPNIWGATEMQVETTIIVTQSSPCLDSSTREPPTTRLKSQFLPSANLSLSMPISRHSRSPSREHDARSHLDYELWSVATADQSLVLQRQQDMVGTLSVPYGRVMSDEAGLFELLHLVRVHGVAFVSETPHCRELSQVRPGSGV